MKKKLIALVCALALAVGLVGCSLSTPDSVGTIGEVDIRKFGSQGQQRTSALSLKLSEIELVKRSIHDTPVLLLDDVLSELDSNRQNYLLNSIHDTQTLITCTGLDEFVNSRFQMDKIFKIVEGTVESEELCVQL